MKRPIARVAVLVVVLHSTQTLVCDVICAPAIATQGSESGHCSQHATTLKLTAGETRCDHAGESDRFTALATTKPTNGARSVAAVVWLQTITAIFDASHAARFDSPPTGPPRVTTLQHQVLRV